MASFERADKANLIRTHLFPLLGRMPAAEQEPLFAQLEIQTHVRRAVAGQYLEEPGPSAEGMAFLLPQAIAHSFQLMVVDGHTHAAGTHIWMRGTLVFNPHALLDALPRTEYTQVLEPGTYLGIRYPQLRQLMTDFKFVEQGISLLARQQERQRLAYHQINRLPPAARVAAFERKFRSFTHVASIQLRSMHVGLSRQTYSKKLP